MKKTQCIYLLLLFNFIVWTSPLSAQTTVLNYQSIPSYSAATCFFNSPPGPVNPKAIGGLNHYGIVGGVDYTGNEFSLGTDATGGGTGFGIFHSFNQNYKYTIKVEAKATAASLTFLWALNSARQAVPSSCSPGFASIIISGASATSSFASIAGSYTEYTLISNFVPATANVTYLLMSAYNTVASIGAVQVRKVTIIATPLCKPVAITSATPLGGLQVQIAFNTPAFTLPITQYDVYMVRYTIIPGFPPIIVPISPHTFPNVGSTSPVTVTLPTAGNYTVTIRSVCSGTGETVNSNTLNVVVN